MAEVRWRTVKLLVSPFLYFASVVPTVFGVMVVFISMEYGGPLHRYAEPLYRYVTPSVDEIGLALILVIGGLAFGVAGWALMLLEGLWRPKLTDHLRRCACLYVLFAILNTVLIPETAKAYRVGGYPPPELMSQVVWLLVGWAILMDALVLLVVRRHFDSIRNGSLA
jgi:hypothetical protein